MLEITKTLCKETKKGKFGKFDEFSDDKWSVIVENVDRMISSGETQDSVESRGSNTRKEESNLIPGQDDAEDRFLVDIGSLFFPPAYPQPVQYPQHNQGSSKASS